LFYGTCLGTRVNCVVRVRLSDVSYDKQTTKLSGEVEEAKNLTRCCNFHVQNCRQVDLVKEGRGDAFLLINKAFNTFLARSFPLFQASALKKLFTRNADM